jgi:hypothetical protein
MDLKIGFRNSVQVVLWNDELRGQISDGYWENARPHNHYKDVSSAVAYTGPGLGPQGFWPRRAYNLAAPDLIECVGDRMLEYVRALPGYEDFTLKELKRELRDMSKILNEQINKARNWRRS